MRTSNEIVYSQDNNVVMANDILKGRQEMTLQEARLIRLLITQVVKEDTDLKTYKVKISELAKFLEIDPHMLYRDMMKICDNLLSRKVRIGTGDPKKPWKIYQWVQLAEYDGAGTITLMLSEQIKPYVIALNKWFTQYPIKDILYMSSYYAIRLYELLRMDSGINKYKKHRYVYTIQELREYFNCTDKLKKISDFKSKVIEIAVREINLYTEIFVTVTYIKGGREITGIEFNVQSNVLHQLNLD